MSQMDQGYRVPGRRLVLRCGYDSCADHLTRSYTIALGPTASNPYAGD